MDKRGLVASRRAALGLVAGSLGTLALPRSGRASGAPAGCMFTVLRGGEPIGRHAIAFVPQGQGFLAQSRVEIEVKVGFLTVFRYHQAADDLWQGGRLVASRIDTDDDGLKTRVEVEEAEGRLYIRSDAGTFEAAAGAMTDLCFWNPRIVHEPVLIDTKSGQPVPIAADGAGQGRLVVHGREVVAERWRIQAEGARSGVVWYDEAGRWVQGRVHARGEVLDYVLA